VRNAAPRDGARALAGLSRAMATHCDTGLTQGRRGPDTSTRRRRSRRRFSHLLNRSAAAKSNTSAKLSRPQLTRHSLFVPRTHTVEPGKICFQPRQASAARRRCPPLCARMAGLHRGTPSTTARWRPHRVYPGTAITPDRPPHPRQHACRMRPWLPAARPPRRHTRASRPLVRSRGQPAERASGADRLPSCKRLSGESAWAPALPNLRRRGHQAAVPP
jgi:hypothetical protein